MLAGRTTSANRAHASVVALRQQLEALAREQIRQQTLLQSYQLARTRLRAQAPQVWRALARQHLQQSNVAIANDLTGMYARALSSPQLYFGAKNQIDRAKRLVGHLLYQRYSPRVALREARVLGVLAADMRRNLPCLAVTEPMRAQIEIVALGGQSTARSDIQQIQNLSDSDLKMYAEMRTLMVQWSLMRVGSQLSSHCKSLAERASRGGISMDDELAYQEYVHQCDVN